jgi:hypothetical protein
MPFTLRRGIHVYEVIDPVLAKQAPNTSHAGARSTNPLFRTGKDEVA